MEDEDLLFELMDELEKMKIRYHVLGTDWRMSATGRGENVWVDRRTRTIQRGVEAVGDLVLQAKVGHEDEPDPDAFMDPVPFTKGDIKSERKVVVGENVTIGENVYEGGQDKFEPVPEHDDLAPTPDFLSPIPSPRLEPFANNDTPLISLPPFATYQPTNAPSPPDSPPPESLFPNPPFPGTFSLDPNDPSSFSGPTLHNFQQRISIALQATLDSLARLGNLTITTAQNTGFPVADPSFFDSARERLDTNATSARNNIHSTLNTARNNLESSIDNARTNIASARANLETQLDIARTSLEASLESARRGLDTGLLGARDGLTNTTRQVETAIRNVAQSVQEANVITPSTTERVITELRTAGEKVERAVEELTLRLQRHIDARAVPPVYTQTQEETREDLYGTPPPGMATSSQRSRGTETYEDGATRSRTLPGAFPAEKSKVEECTDRLVEMGFFGEKERDCAAAVSVVANGDIESALAIVSGSDE